GAVHPPRPRLHRSTAGCEPHSPSREREHERRAVRAGRRGARDRTELTLLEHVLHRRRQERHEGIFSRPGPGGATSISDVHTACDRIGASTPFVSTASPAHTAPPTTAPSTIERSWLAAFTAIHRIHARPGPVSVGMHAWNLVETR